MKKQTKKYLTYAAAAAAAYWFWKKQSAPQGIALPGTATATADSAMQQVAAL